MTSLFARKALLHNGWAEDVLLRIVDGRIASVSPGQRVKDADVLAGIVIPGLSNSHSHAFQRALAGHTERRGPKNKDNFWTWRSRMYRLAGLVDAPRLYAIARQAYSEMVTLGFTSVAEFHYLHREPDGEGQSDAMLRAIASAAADAGIRLIYVPVLYERAGFRDAKPSPEQRRFVMTTDEFVDHYEEARNLQNETLSVGIGAHSLRAAQSDSILELQAIAKRDECPFHIHIAEQIGEVEQCLDRHGLRPVEYLLKTFSPDQHWCLVHATHMNDEEISALAGTRAVVCLCPSTEANLGDGIFPLQSWLERGGHIAIGSDSHVTINPFEELRWLEYGQRLITRTRNVAAIRNSSTGRSLYEHALQGGAMACGLESTGLRKGALADLVVLDDESPMLTGHDKESVLDALVFSGFTLPIDRVMVNGRWVVVEGRHEHYDSIARGYVDAVADIKREMVRH